MLQEWANGDRELDGVDYLLVNNYFKTGRIRILPTYVSVFPQAPSLADSIHSTDISYFVKNREDLTHFGIAIAPIPNGKV